MNINEKPKCLAGQNYFIINLQSTICVKAVETDTTKLVFNNASNDSIETIY